MGRSPDTAEQPHRLDIDGLRGLAIVLVLCSHIWWGQVSGGVDSFLVISGYFLARSTTRRGLPQRLGQAVLRALRQSLHFVKRLIPAATLVLLGTLVLVARFEPRSRWAELSRQVLASLFGFQNWHLASSDQTYARASGTVTPLQQFWSLAVQFQLYVAATAALLLLAYLVRRARRPVALLAIATSLGTVASFGYALHAVSVDQSQAYYDTAARAWEFLAGIALGLVVPMVARQVSRPLTVLRSGVGLIALVALIGTAFLVDGLRGFPGTPTLVPVVATLALLTVGGGGPGVLSSRILLLRPLRALGAISYPLYLWHWPILITALEVTGRPQAGWLLGGLVVVSSVLLAWVTRVTVELPLQEGGRLSLPRIPRRALAGGLALTSAVLPMVWLLHTADLAGQSLPADLAAATVTPVDSTHWSVVPAPEVAPDDGPGTPDGCAASNLEDDLRTCTFGDPAGGRTVVAVGGSHVRMLMPALDAIGQRHGIRIISMIKLACPWSLATRKPGWSSDVRASCVAWGDQATAAVTDLHPDLVLTTGTRPRLRGPGDYVPPHYPKRWLELDQAGIPMVLLRDVPWLPQDVPDCVSSHQGESLSQVAQECGAPRSSVLSTDPVGDFPGPIPASARWIDLTSVICPADQCLPVVGNVLVYRNDSHLTTTFVMAIEPELDRRLGDATGWWPGA